MAHEILWYVISCTTVIAPADKTVPATTGFDREMEETLRAIDEMQEDERRDHASTSEDIQD